MTLKDHIDKIIQTIPNPKSYARSVKGNSTVFTLVEEFMLSHKIENLSEAIYCVHKEILPPKCKCGNKAVFNSFIKGYRQFCGANCPEKGKKHSNAISEYWSNNPVAKSEMLAKKEETMLSKYGVKNPIEIAEVREKMKSTNLTKYGAEYPLQNSDIQTKIKETTLKNHGVEFPFQSSVIRKKAEDTFVNNHGHSNDMRFARKAFDDTNGGNPFQVEWVKDNIKETLLKRYGVNHPAKSSEIYEKSKNTLFLNHKRLNPAQLNIPDELYNIFQSKVATENLFRTHSIRDITERYAVSTELLYSHHDRHGLTILTRRTRSAYEEEIADFLKKNNIQFTRNYTGLCDTRQVDFYIKDHNLAIEFNGLYWHSERAGNKDKTYHESKFLKCRENGVQLLTIFEDEWLSRHGVIKNKIIHLCRNTTTRIGARKIDISVTTNKQEVKEFLEKFHVQGKTEGISIALVGKYKGEIVAVVTLRKCSEGHDMTRYCINNSASYPGLFSKFLTFIKKNKLCETVITFADLRWSTGDVYEKSGFTRVAELPPDYSYTDYKTREHKFNNRKQKLAVKYGVDITGKTESEIALEVGLDRIWDCGKVKYKISF